MKERDTRKERDSQRRGLETMEAVVTRPEDGAEGSTREEESAEGELRKTSRTDAGPVNMQQPAQQSGEKT